MLFYLLMMAATVTSAQNFGSQQWDGPLNSTGQIYRTGNVGIGNTGSSAYLTVGDNSATASLLRMGKIVNPLSNERLFNFGSAGNYAGFTFYNMANEPSLEFNSNNSSSYLGLKDYAGSEVFKTSFSEDGGAYIHLPKLDSKVVIGDFASYLSAEDHKLIVKDGSAKIEGNIFTDSRIGIGTDLFTDFTGDYRLSVDGRIRATAVRVYTGWADFVFEDNYELPTLIEVENHIDKFGHLKDIPSAAIVESQGIDVGEMNKLLLQKIEELTLYVIELNKEVEELKSK